LPDVGPTTARLLASRFGTLPRLRAASREAFRQINGLGDATGASVHRALHTPAMSALLDAMLQTGVVVEAEQPARTGPLAGRRVVFTGELSHLTRKEAAALAESLGAMVQSDVTRTTDLVVAGDRPGRKLSAAKRRGVRVLTERAFLELVRRPRGGKSARASE
jgi:DNA ligase (NAD+)